VLIQLGYRPTSRRSNNVLLMYKEAKKYKRCKGNNGFKVLEKTGRKFFGYGLRKNFYNIDIVH